MSFDTVEKAVDPISQQPLSQNFLIKLSLLIDLVEGFEDQQRVFGNRTIFANQAWLKNIK